MAVNGVNRRLDRLYPETTRPFRLYNATKRKFFLWRMYARKYVAMRNAFWITHWLQVDEVVEVIDVRTGRLHGTYVMRRGPTVKGKPTYQVAFQDETLKTCQDTIRLPGEGK